MIVHHVPETDKITLTRLTHTSKTLYDLTIGRVYGRLSHRDTEKIPIRQPFGHIFHQDHPYFRHVRSLELPRQFFTNEWSAHFKYRKFTQLRCISVNAAMDYEHSVPYHLTAYSWTSWNIPFVPMIVIRNALMCDSGNTSWLRLFESASGRIKKVVLLFRPIDWDAPAIADSLLGLYELGRFIDATKCSVDLVLPWTDVRDTLVPGCRRCSGYQRYGRTGSSAYDALRKFCVDHSSKTRHIRLISPSDRVGKVEAVGSGSHIPRQRRETGSAPTIDASRPDTQSKAVASGEVISMEDFLQEKDCRDIFTEEEVKELVQKGYTAPAKSVGRSPLDSCE